MFQALHLRLQIALRSLDLMHINKCQDRGGEPEPGRNGSQHNPNQTWRAGLNGSADANDFSRKRGSSMAMRMLLVGLVLLASGTALADSTITSRKDSLGYTHYRGDHLTGTSRRNSLGQVHSDWNVNGKRSKCISRTDSLGYTRTTCH